MPFGTVQDFVYSGQISAPANTLAVPRECDKWEIGKNYIVNIKSQSLNQS